MPNVTLIPGDGIGPEVSDVMQRVVAATGVDMLGHPGSRPAYAKENRRTGT